MGTLISWEALKTKQYESPLFWIQNYICEAGVTFFFGASSLGKSPLTWSMAKAIGTGTPWFGLPVRQGRVLYIDVDSPERVAAARLQQQVPAQNVWFLFSPRLSVQLDIPETEAMISHAREVVRPDVVFINTLRNVHDLDDKDSRTAKIVYSAFHRWFPNTALVFVHHPRKRPTHQNIKEDPRETASGTLAFVNDAQIGIMLRSKNNKTRTMELLHQKSQVGPLVGALPLTLGIDGSTFTCPAWDELKIVYEIFNEEKLKNTPDSTIDKLVAAKLGFSPATARRRREYLESYGPVPPWSLISSLTEDSE